MSDEVIDDPNSPSTKVVAIRMTDCPEGEGEKQHVIEVKLENDSVIVAKDLIDLMDAGRRYFMIPPPGAPAYEAHKATGLPLIIQVRVCPDCKERVLFA